MMLSAHAVQAAPVELTMWDIPESDVYTAWWNKHIDAFNAAHPDIHVTLEVFETEAYRSKIASALAAGTTPEIFNFSVRDDAVAAKLNQTIGKRVAISYEQHKGVPTQCFGETDYFVTDVKAVE